MTTNAAASSDSVNGLRTLELGSALLLLRDQLVKRLRGGSRTISTVGSRTREEQEIVGMSQILFVMFPLAIELALKSLRVHLHAQGYHEPKHELDDLFVSLPKGANDPDDAQRAQDEARDLWTKSQKDNLVSYVGTLDEFLREHRKNFISTRYYDWSNLKNQQVNDYVACYFCVLQPLIARDPETGENFVCLYGDTADALRPGAT